MLPFREVIARRMTLAVCRRGGGIGLFSVFSTGTTWVIFHGVCVCMCVYECVCLCMCVCVGVSGVCV